MCRASSCQLNRDESAERRRPLRKGGLTLSLLSVSLSLSPLRPEHTATPRVIVLPTAELRGPPPPGINCKMTRFTITTFTTLYRISDYFFVTATISTIFFQITRDLVTTTDSPYTKKARRWGRYSALRPQRSQCSTSRRRRRCRARRALCPSASRPSAASRDPSSRWQSMIIRTVSNIFYRVVLVHLVWPGFGWLRHWMCCSVS